MTTIKDVAEKAGVSLATVSHVVNGTRYVSPELTQRVKEAMQKLDYQPNALARSLRTNRTHTISLIVSDISNPFFASIVRGVEDAAAENGFRVIVSNTDEDPITEDHCLTVLQQRRTDGFIIVPTGVVGKGLKRLTQSSTPFVFVDRRVDGIDADIVLSENVNGAYQATAYLIEQGHTRIGIILGRKGVTPSEERFCGYEKALKEAGLPIEEDLIKRGDFRIDGGGAACHELLQLAKPPSAVFVVNNRMVIGAMEAIREVGLKCPDDISIVGFDDFDWVGLLEPPLTTVSQQPYQIGYQASELLTSKIVGRAKHLFQEYRVSCNLVCRSSVANVGMRSSHEAKGI